MWRLKDQANGNDKMVNAQLIKQKLESLNGKIPGMLKMEVGLNILDSECASDLVLYSEFESQQALSDYQNHPEHIAIKPFVFEARTERREIDYEV